jgi:hypothetical protein
VPLLPAKATRIQLDVGVIAIASDDRGLPIDSARVARRSEAWRHSSTCAAAPVLFARTPHLAEVGLVDELIAARVLA